MNFDAFVWLEVEFYSVNNGEKGGYRWPSFFFFEIRWGEDSGGVGPFVWRCIFVDMEK